ncbi:porin family protein [Mucilaginibacter litoreus]|uniref:Porin family protein n=1 Tax=Mucilaginibacter litoreus TaxID=1048221 RepID=A0ABW3AQ52_9SPHI
MKKILLSICCAFAVSATFAQTPTVGIKGGLNLASLTSSSNTSSSSITTGTLTSFSAGIFVDFKAGSNWSVQPALLYTGKGAKESGEFDETNITIKAKINYLQLPLNFVYNVNSVAGTFYIGAGPYLGYGLSAKLEGNSNGQSESDDIGFGDGEDQYKRIDAGATALIGYKFKQGVLLNLNYDLGLTDISNQSSSSTKTRVFGISVGYAF